MNQETHNLLMVVVCFSMITKIYKDVNTLLFVVPDMLIHLLGSFTELFSLITFLRLMNLMLTIIGSIIIPLYIVKYITIKKRITLQRDFVQFMFKPQLYCAVLSIIQWLIGLTFTILH